jgi:hypothetical protein
VNVGIILLLLIFIFSIIGMNLFAGVRYGFAGGGLTPDGNFDSFFVAMLTLFRSSTGENFNGIMHDLEVAAPYCLPEDTPEGLTANCGDKIAPAVYFSLFATLSSFVLIKLLVAVVLDSFSDMLAAEEESEEFKLTPDMLEAYTTAWGKCDPAATKFLKEGGILRLVTLLDHPLGVHGAPNVESLGSERKAAMAALSELDLPPSSDGMYQFHAVLQELVKRAAAGGGTSASTILPRTRLAGDITEAQYTLRDTMAAVRIQGLFRANRAKRLVRRLIREMREKKAAAAAAAANGGDAAAAAAATAAAAAARPAGLGNLLRSMSRKEKKPLAAARPAGAAGAGGAGVGALEVVREGGAEHHPVGRQRWGARARERAAKDKELYGT